MSANNRSSSPFDHKYFRTLILCGALTAVSLLALIQKWEEVAPVTEFPWGVAAGFVGGEFALITFLFNRKQQQVQFESKMLHEQFVDIQNRFTEPEIKTRAGMALRLGEFALTPRPGNITAHERTQERYPYFLPSVSQLAVALHTETDESVRAAIVQALLNVGDFAKKEYRESDDDSLLSNLIHRLADANRTACSAFGNALAEFDAFVDGDLTVTQGNAKAEEYRNLLMVVAPFCKRPEFNHLCLYALRQAEENQRHYALYRSVRQTQNREEQAQTDAGLLEKVKRSAFCLLAARDALAGALRAPEPDPSNRPSEKPPLPHARIAGVESPVTYVKPGQGNMMQRRRRERTHNLKGCFLAGANLREAHMQEADLVNALLHGADLTGAQLQGADLTSAQLQGASLTRAKIGGISYEQGLDTDYLSANFRGADWSNADFRHPAHTGDDLRLKQWLERNYPPTQEPPIEASYSHLRPAPPPLQTIWSREE